MKEKMGSRFTFCDELPSRINSGIVRTWDKTCLERESDNHSVLRKTIHIPCNYAKIIDEFTKL